MTAKQTITFATFQELLPDSCNHPLKKQLRDKARYYKNNVMHWLIS